MLAVEKRFFNLKSKITEALAVAMVATTLGVATATVSVVVDAGPAAAATGTYTDVLGTGYNGYSINGYGAGAGHSWEGSYTPHQGVPANGLPAHNGFCITRGMSYPLGYSAVDRSYGFDVIEAFNPTSDWQNIDPTGLRLYGGNMTNIEVQKLNYLIWKYRDTTDPVTAAAMMVMTHVYSGDTAFWTAGGMTPSVDVNNVAYGADWPWVNFFGSWTSLGDVVKLKTILLASESDGLQGPWSLSGTAAYYGSTGKQTAISFTLLNANGVGIPNQAVHVAVTNGNGTGNYLTDANGKFWTFPTATNASSPLTATGTIIGPNTYHIWRGQYNTQQLATTNGDITVSATVSVSIPLQRVQVAKFVTNSAYQTPNGAVFELRDITGTTVLDTLPILAGTWWSNWSTALVPGSYKVYETVAPEGQLLAAPVTVDASYHAGGATVHLVNFTNSVAHTGQITVTKVDGTNGGTVAGATVSVAYDSNHDGAYDTTVGTYTTPATVTGLQAGNYQIIETTAPPGFVLPTLAARTKTATLTWGDVSTTADNVMAAVVQISDNVKLDYGITVTGGGAADIDSTLTWVVAVHNYGDEVGNYPTVSFTPPSSKVTGLTWSCAVTSAGVSGAVCAAAGQPTTGTGTALSLPSISGGGEVQWTVTGTIKPTAAAGTFASTATITPNPWVGYVQETAATNIAANTATHIDTVNAANIGVYVYSDGSKDTVGTFSGYEMIEANGYVNFYMQVVNTGGKARNVTVNVPLPATGVPQTSYTTQETPAATTATTNSGLYNAATNTLTLPVLPRGAWMHVHFVGTADQFADWSTVTRTVTGALTSPHPSPHPSGSATVEMTGISDLEVIAYINNQDTGVDSNGSATRAIAQTEVGPISLGPSSLAVWKVSVTNNGPFAETNVQVAVSVPAEVSTFFTSPPAGTTYSSGVWAIPNIGVGVTKRLTITTYVNPTWVGSANPGAPVVLTAEVSASDGIDPDSTQGNSVVDEDDIDDAAFNITSTGITVGDFVFNDVNKDGLYDPATESGIAGVPVSIQLQTPVDVVFGSVVLAPAGTVYSTTTDANGNYSFQNLWQGESWKVFFYPASAPTLDPFTNTQWQLTTPNVGVDDTIDSDPDPATGNSTTSFVATGTTGIWDAGAFIKFVAPVVGQYTTR